MTARKHWFKVPDAVLFEDWSDEQLAILIRLQAYLNVQWARGGKDDSERGTAVLRPAEMTLVTGRKRTDNAVVALRKLAGISDLTIEFPNGNAVISWPKYAEFQKSQTDKRPGKGHSGSGSGSGSISKTPEERERAASPPTHAHASGPTSSGPKDRKKPKARRAPLPNPLTVQDREYVRQRSSEFSVDPAALEQALCDWAYGGGYEYVDWGRQLGVMLRGRWRWTEPLFATPNQPIRNDRESAAQARERRTKEAMLEAFRRGSSETDGASPPLIALAGGREWTPKNARSALLHGAGLPSR